MGKTLVMAEKPSQARDYAEALGCGGKNRGFLEGAQHVVTWAVGHLLELAEPHDYYEALKRWSMATLPILPEQFRYKPGKDGKDQLAVIGQLLKRDDIDRVVVATDAGREGELIARLILNHHRNRKPVFRFWTSSALTPDVVRAAMSAVRPSSDYDRLYSAAYARQQADWLVGINATRAYTIEAGVRGEVYSLGRVQTPVLAMIVKRAREISNFVPEKFFRVVATFGAAGGAYDGVYFSEGEDGGSKLKTLEACAEIVDTVRAAGRGIVENLTVEKKKEAPPQLFSLTSLQQEANRIYGFSADRTLELAQALYDAKKAISYPRTESKHLGAEMAATMPSVLDAVDSLGVVPFDRSLCTVNPKDKRVFDNAKLTDHHAIIPTGRIQGGALNDQEMKLFQIVVRRFVATFYPVHTFESTSISTRAGGHLFNSAGKVTIDPGWTVFYKTQGGQQQESSLPKLRKGEKVEVEKIEPKEGQTEPPKHYNDATLLKDMENAKKFVKDASLAKVLRDAAGLGTPATRASIISGLVNRRYIYREGKNIHPTEKGITLIAAVDGESIADPAYTALWEQELDDLANGRNGGAANADTFVAKAREYATHLVATVRGKKGGLAGAVTASEPDAVKKGEGQSTRRGGGASGESPLGTCPECGSVVAERPKSYSCSKAGCRFTIWKNSFEKLGQKTISPAHIRQYLTGKNIKLNGLKGRSGKEFEAGSELFKDPEYGWKIRLLFEDKKD